MGNSFKKLKNIVWEKPKVIKEERRTSTTGESINVFTYKMHGKIKNYK